MRVRRAEGALGVRERSPIDLSPLFDLRLRTARLELRLPTTTRSFARTSRKTRPSAGVHAVFRSLDGRDQVARDVDGFAAYHRGRGRVGDLTVAPQLRVWTDEGLIGTQGVEANSSRHTHGSDGIVARAAIQGRGYGTEMRAAVLELAFAGLGAGCRCRGARDVASTRVSEKLGYEPAGEATACPRGEPVREQRFRLTREAWESRARIDVEIVGLELCLPLFGL